MSGRQVRNVRVWGSVAVGGMVTWAAVSCSSPDRRFVDGDGGKSSGSGGSGAGHSGRGNVSGGAGRANSNGGKNTGPDTDGGSGGSDESPSGGAPASAGTGGSQTTTGGALGTGGLGTGGTSSVAGNGGKGSVGGGGTGAGGTSSGTGGKASNGGTSSSAGSGGTSSNAGSGGKATSGGTGGTPSIGGSPSSGGSNPGDVTPPTVVSVTPTGTGVVKNAAIVVKFSESMKTTGTSPVTLTSAGTAVALGTGLWSASNTTLTLQPTSELAYATGEDPLTAKTFTITVQTSAQDAAGNALAAAYTSSFSTLRRLQTLVTATEQTGYYSAESASSWGASTTFYANQQMPGNGYEDQHTYGLVGFPKTDATLAGAAANAESVSLELYPTTTLSGATVTFTHINSSNLSEVYTTLGAPKLTTTTSLTSFPAANTWWNVDVTPVFKHATFNLSSYYSLQFLITLDAASGTTPGVTKQVTFAGGTATSNKPRIRVTRLIP